MRVTNLGASAPDDARIVRVVGWVSAFLSTTLALGASAAATLERRSHVCIVDGFERGGEWVFNLLPLGHRCLPEQQVSVGTVIASWVGGIVMLVTAFLALSIAVILLVGRGGQGNGRRLNLCFAISALLAAAIGSLSVAVITPLGYMERAGLPPLPTALGSLGALTILAIGGIWGRLLRLNRSSSTSPSPPGDADTSDDESN